MNDDITKKLLNEYFSDKCPLDIKEKVEKWIILNIDNPDFVEKWLVNMGGDKANFFRDISTASEQVWKKISIDTNT